LNLGQNLVVNGSFESPVVTANSFNYFASVPVWMGTASGGGATDIELWNGSFGGMTALNSTQHLEINGRVANQSVSQVVNGLPVDCPMTFCFAYAGRPGFTNNSFLVELSGATALSVSLNPASFTSAGWQVYSITFTPLSSSITIRFTGTSTAGVAGGAHIDNVSLTQQGPSLTCPADITLNTVGDGAVVNYPAPTVTGGTLRDCAPPSGSTFALGTTVVTCTATNGCGSNTCTFNVTVRQVICLTNGIDLVVNGSFETPVVANNNSTFVSSVPGWMTTDSLGDFELWAGSGTSIPVLAGNGNQHLEINARDSDETVSQVVTGLNTNCPATLCFYYTGRFPNPLNNTFEVTVLGSTLTPVTRSPVSHAVGGWQLY